MEGMLVRQTRHERESVPFGSGYPTWLRRRAVTRTGSAVDVSSDLGVSVPSVYRFRRRFALTGSLTRLPLRGGQARVMDETNLERVRILTHAAPAIRRGTVRQILSELGTNVSPSTVSRAWKTLKFSFKRLRIHSSTRDEGRRVRFWVNPPQGEVGIAGVFGIPSYQFIDIDEAGIELKECNAHFGHAPIGQRAEAPGVVSVLQITNNKCQ
jgi:transposase